MWILLSFVAFSFVGLSNCLDQAQIQAIDKLIIEQFQPLNRIPGVGLAIVHGDDSLARGYGYRDLEQGLQSTSGTFFGIASVSKSFLGLVVLRVLTTTFPELGESVLDVPIRELVPSYNFMSIDRYRSENMNMRDLLSHRACTQSEYWGIFTAPYKDKAEFVYRQRYAEPLCLARTEFVYNNGLIQQAGEIAAHIAGVPFEDLLMQLLADIGMTNTTFVRENVDYETMPLMSKPYYLDQSDVVRRFNLELIKPVFIAPGSGGMLTTPAEFVKYLRFHLNGGRVGSTQVIPEHVLKWMYRVTNPFKDPVYRSTNDTGSVYGDIGYGLCFFIGIHDGFQRIRHSGHVTPYETLVTMIPAHKIGVFTTINGPGEAHTVNFTQAALNAMIENILIHGPDAASHVDPHLRPGQMEAGTSPLKSRSGLGLLTVNGEPQKEYGPRQIQEPRDLPGIYGHPTSGDLNVTRVNETTLYMSYGRFAQAWLTQRGSTDIYDVDWDSDFPQFYMADEGKVPQVSLDFSSPLVLYLDADGNRTPFWKDATLDSLPVQPWEPGTC